MSGAPVLWYVLTAVSVAFMIDGLATNTILAIAIAIATRFAPIVL